MASDSIYINGKTYYRCITQNDVLDKGKGYIFSGQDGIDNNWNRCLTSSYFDNARNSKCSIAYDEHTSIAYSGGYNSNQLMCVQDIVTRTAFLVIVRIRNIDPDDDGWSFDSNGYLSLYIKAHGSDDTWKEWEYAGISLSDIYFYGGTYKDYVFTVKDGIDLSKYQYFVRAHAYNKEWKSNITNWRYPSQIETDYTCITGNYKDFGSEWIPVQPRDYISHISGTGAGEYYCTVLNCYNNQNQWKDYAGLDPIIELRSDW